MSDRNHQPPFLYLVRQLSTSSFEAIRGAGHPSGNPGTVDASGSEFRNVMNTVISSLPDDATTAERPQGIIYIQGSNLNCLTGTINVNRALIIDGLGTAVVQKAGTYTDIRTAMFQIARSNVTIRNMTIEDTDLTHDGANPNTDSKAAVIGITCGPPSQHAICKNLMIENIFFKNIYYHALTLNGATPTSRTIDHVTIRNCLADASSSNTPAGAAFVIGAGVKDCLIENNKIYECGHSGIDIWGALEHVKCINNYVYKSVKPDGCGIAIVRFADHLANEGLAEDCIIMGNRVYGPLRNDGIKVHAEARKVSVIGNFVDGTTSNGISVLVDNVEGSDKYSREVLIHGNIVRNTGEQGIKANVDPEITYPHGIIVTGNLVIDSKRHGIDFNSNVRFGIINNNTVNGFGTIEAAGTYSGIHLRICKNCSVNGNTLYGTASNATYSVYEEGTGSDRNIITSNNCNKTMSTVGTNTIISNNQTTAAT